MAKLTIELDAKQVTRELNRLIKGPTRPIYRAFESAMTEAFFLVSERIHIETGSLKTTPKIDTRMVEPFVWEGTIRVGGAAPGMPRDPAYYAVFELARGGDHFFFEPAHEVVPTEIVLATLEYLASGENAA